MRRSRAPSNWPGPFFAARSWAACTTNMFGFDLRQARASLFHHRPADPKSIEPTHCQVGLPLALQARQGLLIRAHRSYAYWKQRIEASDQRERQVHATLFTFAEDHSEFAA